MTINFTTLDPQGNAGLHWTQLEILGDDYVQWTSGSFTDLDTSPLPVQLTGFTASLVQSNGVLLKWSTASETNNYGFTVQRKGDGDAYFTDLPGGFVGGRGTTVETQFYTYTDNGVTATGRYSYRLQQEDLDGTVHFSESVTVFVSATDVVEVAPHVFQLLQNYPNPFNPSTQVKFSVEKTGKAVVKVYTILGAEVATLFEGIAEAGRYYTMTFDAANLASGIYFYRLRTDTKTDIRKLLLLR